MKQTPSSGPSEIIKSNWNVIWWILGSIFIPLSMPYILCNIMAHLKQRLNRDSLQGKVVVITGASSGLGEALAHSFYTSGCKVVLTSRRKEELERVKTDLLENHSQIPTHPPVVVPLDLSDLNSLKEKVDHILKIFGHIDILVNNGGVGVRADVLSTAIDIDIKVMLVNYFGSVALTKAVLPSMIKRKEGKIVCIGSVQGKFAIPHRSAYSASKHALQAFCDSLRSEVASHNIKVLLVSPGYMNTALSLNALTGTGRNYGITDSSTAGGANPNVMANDIVNAVLRDDKDVIFSTIVPKVAYCLRFLCPALYFWVMEKRARKIETRKD